MMKFINLVLFRNFYALFALVVFIGAESYSLTLAAVALAFVLDRLRDRFAPKHVQVLQQLFANPGSGVPTREGLIVLYVLFAVWAAYSIGFLSLELALPESTMRSYLDVWRGPHEATIALFYRPRTNFADMVAADYEYRAWLTVHAEMIAHVFMIATTVVWVWLGGFPNLRETAKLLSSRQRTIVARSVRSYGPLAGFVFFALLYLSMSVLLLIDFSPDSRRDYAQVPHLSNISLWSYQAFCAAFTVMWATAAYAARTNDFWLRYRARLVQSGEIQPSRLRERWLQALSRPLPAFLRAPFYGAVIGTVVASLRLIDVGIAPDQGAFLRAFAGLLFMLMLAFAFAVVGFFGFLIVYAVRKVSQLVRKTS